MQSYFLPQQAFAHSGPALIDVAVARRELSLPPTISIAQAAGFNLYMLKAMLHGDGHEALDMAETNLRRSVHPRVACQNITRP